MRKITSIHGHNIIYNRHGGYPMIRINKRYVKVHRYVWEHKYGKIPPNMEIHHKDLNKENFNLNNLQLMTTEEHRRLHAIKNKLGHDNLGKTKDYVSGCCPARIPVVLWKGKKKYYFGSLYKAFNYLGKHSTSTLWKILNGKTTEIEGWKLKYAKRKKVRAAS